LIASVCSISIYDISQCQTKKSKTKITSENIDDKICDVWVFKAKRRKIWVYKGIPIKIIENNDGIETVFIAVSIEEDIEVPEEKFTVPDNIYFMEEDISTIILS